jgi:hypothetical protein
LKKEKWISSIWSSKKWKMEAGLNCWCTTGRRWKWAVCTVPIFYGEKIQCILSILVFSLVSCQTTQFSQYTKFKGVFQIVMAKREKYFTENKFKFFSINTGFIFMVCKLSYFTCGYHQSWNISFHTTLMKMNPVQCNFWKPDTCGTSQKVQTLEVPEFKSLQYNLHCILPIFLNIFIMPPFQEEGFANVGWSVFRYTTMRGLNAKLVYVHFLKMFRRRKKLSHLLHFQNFSI